MCSSAARREPIVFGERESEDAASPLACVAVCQSPALCRYRLALPAVRHRLVSGGGEIPAKNGTTDARERQRDSGRRGKGEDRRTVQGGARNL